MTALLIAAIAAGAAIPQVQAGGGDLRVLSAARHLATRMQVARAEAIARGQAVGVRVAIRGREVFFAIYRDGNHNGIRTIDIASGQDLSVEPEVPLAALYAGVAVGAADGMAPPPVAGEQILLFSFSPMGTSSSGTIYLRGQGPHQYAVRALGATGRVRVLRLLPSSGAWVDVR